MSPSDSLDIIRTLRMAGFGLLILGTAQHLWFDFVARVLPKRDIVSTLKKLLMGQLGFGPVINSIFFSFNAALQGTHWFPLSFICFLPSSCFLVLKSLIRFSIMLFVTTHK